LEFEASYVAEVIAGEYVRPFAIEIRQLQHAGMLSERPPVFSESCQKVSIGFTRGLAVLKALSNSVATSKQDALDDSCLSSLYDCTIFYSVSVALCKMRGWTGLGPFWGSGQLYPKVHRRYSSLPVLGPIVEGQPGAATKYPV
jgi:hypothetical protein